MDYKLNVEQRLFYVSDSFEYFYLFSFGHPQHQKLSVVCVSDIVVSMFEI